MDRNRPAVHSCTCGAGADSSPDRRAACPTATRRYHADRVRRIILPAQGYLHRATLLETGWRPDTLRRTMAEQGLQLLRRTWVVAPDLDLDLRHAATLGGVVTCVSATNAFGLWRPDGTNRPHIRLPPHSSGASARRRHARSSGGGRVADDGRSPGGRHRRSAFGFGLGDSLRARDAAGRRERPATGGGRRQPVDGLIGDRLVIQIDSFAHHSDATQRRKDIRHDRLLRSLGSSASMTWTSSTVGRGCRPRCCGRSRRVSISRPAGRWREDDRPRGVRKPPQRTRADRSYAPGRRPDGCRSVRRAAERDAAQRNREPLVRTLQGLVSPRR